jgi:hypothetical protein
MSEEFAGSPDLWISAMPSDQGPEGNLQMWSDAEDILDGLCKMFEGPRVGGVNTDGVTVALVDAYNRCIEERRRATDLLELHKVWESRSVGGIPEPDSPIRPPER